MIGTANRGITAGPARPPFAVADRHRQTPVPRVRAIAFGAPTSGANLSAIAWAFARIASSARTRRTAVANFSGDDRFETLIPTPWCTTRAALSGWSRLIGTTITGTPAASERVTVPWPPWVITRSTWGSTAPCGADSTRWTLPGTRATGRARMPGPGGDQRVAIDTAERVDEPLQQILLLHVGGAQRQKHRRATVVGPRRRPRRGYPFVRGDREAAVHDGRVRRRRARNRTPRW